MPWGSSREPGLILISTAGEIRLWDSVGIGLAGGDRYSTTYLELISEDIVTGLKRVDVSVSNDDWDSRSLKCQLDRLKPTSYPLRLAVYTSLS